MGTDMGWRASVTAVRTINRLSAIEVQRLKRPGYHCDGGGLYLRVTHQGTKSWLFRFTLAARTRDMGLGPYPAVSLAAAREAALICRQKVAADEDPIDARVAERTASRLASAQSITFRSCSEAYIGAHEASWSNDKHLDQLLPAKTKLSRVRHHSALPYQDIGTFMTLLRKMESGSARALEFLILTATRTSETLGARWSEINRDDGVWKIPAARMKGRRDHRVPLSSHAIRVLNLMAAVRRDDFVFPGTKPGRPTEIG